jgi:hypothetical protein
MRRCVTAHRRQDECTTVVQRKLSISLTVCLSKHRGPIRWLKESLGAQGSR